MEACTRKKAIGGPGYSVSGGNVAFRGRNQEDRQNCNRLGSATRFSFMTATQMGRPEKTKFAGSSVRSTSNKALVVGSSSRSPPLSTSKHAIDKQQERSFPEELSHGEERSSIGDEIVTVQSSGESNFVRRPSLSSTGSSSRSCKQRNESNPRNQEISLSSSLKRPVTSTSGSSRASKPVSQNVRNLGCNSVRKRLYECETSSSRAKSITASFTSGVSASVSRRGSAATSSLSRSESSLPIQASRRGRIQQVRGQGTVSVRTRRSSIGNTGTRSPEQRDDNHLSLAEPIINPQSPQDQASTCEAVSDSSSRSVHVELPPVFRESLGRRSSSSRARRNRLISRVEDRSCMMFPGPVDDRDGYQHLNIEDIAEVLLALDRIEQDVELSYEQILVLETNLILGRRSYYDQHRDMRMDIDNMTYEELLALEEKMGTVSTALSEEALTKCLQRAIYMSDSSIFGHTSNEGDDTKCSICQEEFASGEEVGKLGCKHLFHYACVHHWLRLKNWCPICKASACPS